MKTKNITTLFIILIGILFSFSACNSESQIKVPKEIETALYEKYKEYSINSLEWHLVDNFFVGEYRRSKPGEDYHCKSWFDAKGKWHMTETKDFAFDNDLPTEVKQNFEGSGYNRNNIVEIYEVDFSDLSLRYLIQTKTETLFYRSNGDLFKQDNSNWQNRPIVIDSEMLKYIDENFEKATIINAEIKSSPLYVYIFEERYKTVCFDSPTQWLATFWKVPLTEKIPDIVQETLFAITDGKTPNERYQMEYFAPQEVVVSLLSTNEGKKKIVYVFIFSDGTDTVYIDENGQIVNSENIPL